jgi:hypothetical protein
VVNSRCMILTIHVHLTLRLRMRGAIPLLFPYTSMECTGTIPVYFFLYDRYVFFFSFLVFMVLRLSCLGFSLASVRFVLTIRYDCLNDKYCMYCAGHTLCNRFALIPCCDEKYFIITHQQGNSCTAHLWKTK